MLLWPSRRYWARRLRAPATKLGDRSCSIRNHAFARMSPVNQRHYCNDVPGPSRAREPVVKSPSLTTPPRCGHEPPCQRSKARPRARWASLRTPTRRIVEPALPKTIDETPPSVLPPEKSIIAQVIGLTSNCSATREKYHHAARRKRAPS